VYIYMLYPGSFLVLLLGLVFSVLVCCLVWYPSLVAIRTGGYLSLLLEFPP